MISRKLFIGAVVVATTVALVGARRRPAHSVPTFNREVVRIFQQNCQTCHRPGGIGPMPLTTYEPAYEARWRIWAMTSTRQMPPWKPDPSCGAFQHERRLSNEDIDTLAAWVRSGAPEGDRDDLPAPLDFNDGWSLGTPDLILEMPQAYTPPATAMDTFRLFPLPYTFAEDVYVRAVDLEPGARELIHHSLIHVDSSGQSDILDAQDPEPGYDYTKVGIGFEASGFLGTWVPGQPAQAVPAGMALKIPAHSKIVLEIHYHVHDGHPPRPDRTRLGLYFTHAPVQKLLNFGSINNADFVIPAGESNYRITGTWTPDKPLHLVAVGAHMHYVGRRMDIRANFANGNELCLLTVNDWDPAWQGLYDLREPIAIPAGTTLTVDGYYDNTSANPRNPNSPPKDVRSGGSASDEMCIGYITYTWDDEQLAQ